MVEFKVVIGDPKTGKSKQIEVKDNNAEYFLGKKIGDTITGEVLDLTGYEFLITGGSDNAGFPMRKDIEGMRRVKIFAISGVGINKKEKGTRQRKTVAPRTITENTAQINLKVTKYGKTPLFEEPKEESKEEPKTES